MTTSLLCSDHNLLDNGLIVILGSLASYKLDNLLAVVALVLSITRPSLISLLPICLTATLYKRNKNGEQMCSYIIIFVGVLLVRFAVWWMISNYSYGVGGGLWVFMDFSSEKYYEWLSLVRASLMGLLTNKMAILYYTPSLGVRWYLDAQMLPEFALYFELLFVSIPMLCSSILSYVLCPQDMLCAMDVSAAIIILFRREISVADVLFGMSLLMQYPHIICKMRHLPFIVTGIAVPLVLSPLMFVLWVDYGTGNANYFFFQGVCLWLFAALGIAEFTNTLLKQQ